MKKEYFIESLKSWFSEQANYKSISEAKAVIGVSGGKDSSVVAALACKALGPENVYGIMMPNGVQADIDDSMELAKILGFDRHTVNIGGSYSDILSELSLCGFEYGKQVETNLPARLRMCCLYAIAQSVNGRVLGTGNLSESLVGYTTLWGDSVCDFNPIANLFVDEVIELGESLGLPEKFTRKPPNDGMCGKTDEENLGFTYEDVRNWSEERFCGREVSSKHLPIERMHFKTKFKRELLGNIPSIFVPRTPDLKIDWNYLTKKF